MGFFESFGAGLGAVQEQDRQRNAITQQLLTQLISQNPALAETPEIQQALAEAFPNEQYAGITDAFGAVNQARLGEEERQAGVARGLVEQNIIDQAGVGAAQAGIDWGDPASVQAALLELSSGVRGKAADARTLELSDEELEHKRALELAGIRAAGAGSGGRAIAGALGPLGAGILGALKQASGVTEVPTPEPGAEAAAQADIDLVQGQLEPRKMGLAQVTHLHESLAERSSGITSLWREFNSDPEGFARDYGQDWANAKAYVAANEARDPGGLMATIGSNAETRALYENMENQARVYLQGKADERRVSVVKESAFDVVNRSAEAAGQPAPFPPGDESGDVLYPGQGDQVYTQPELTFDMLAPPMQEMYMRGESVNGLNAMYSEIIKIHGFDMEKALVDMRDLEREFIRAGYLEPMYGGQ